MTDLADFYRGLYWGMDFGEVARKKKPYVLCGNCGKLIPAKFSACINCRKPFPPEYVYCPYCRSELIKTLTYAPTAGRSWTRTQHITYTSKAHGREEVLK
ncbi:MAG: hypothetical protein QXX99_02040 [Candidatus Bathyarchaeia archaeon]